MPQAPLHQRKVTGDGQHCTTKGKGARRKPIQDGLRLGKQGGEMLPHVH